MVVVSLLVSMSVTWDVRVDECRCAIGTEPWMAVASRVDRTLHIWDSLTLGGKGNVSGTIPRGASATLPPPEQG